MVDKIVDPEDKGPGLSIFSEGETIDIITKYIMSREYWVFIFEPDSRSLSALNQIETKYYTPGTDKNKDFTLVMSLQSVNFALAKKTQMSKRQLGEFMIKDLINGPVAPGLEFVKQKTLESMINDFMAKPQKDIIPMIEYGNDAALNRIMAVVMELDDYYEKQKTGT